MVGHSTGGGEVARYIGRHGTARVAKAVLIGAVPPLMLKTEANPGGLPIEAFDEIRAGVMADRSQFYKDLSMPFYGDNRPGAKVRKACATLLAAGHAWLASRAAYDCIKAFSETDFTEDLKKFDIPTLIIARRRRPDRADRRAALLVGEAGQGRDAEGLPRRAARPVPDAQGPVQRRPAGLPQALTLALVQRFDQG